jgi:Fe-S cluster biogenesis protein NfuA
LTRFSIAGTLLSCAPDPFFIDAMYSATTPSERTVSQRIEGALDTIRPALHIDGGDVEFVGFNDADGVVQIRLVGACGGCPISSVTVKHGIERRVKAAVPEVTGISVI